MDLLPSNEMVQNYSEGLRPSPQNILAYISYACRQLQAPFSVKTNVIVQDVYDKVDEKPKRSRRRTILQPHQAATPSSQQASKAETAANTCQTSEESVFTSGFGGDTNEIVITAVQNAAGRLVELVFNRCAKIPHLLIRVIGFCLPYQYHLYRLTVRWGPLNGVGLYEFSRFLSDSYLTEIYLDDSPVAERNYEVLLERPSRLQSLSLSRCELSDADCAKLAAFLEYPCPASKTLHILILVSNMIGDEGARELGKALRTNRTLQCLNLAGNYITDSGAITILKTFMEFPISNDELFAKRSRHLEYLKIRNEVYVRCINDLNSEKNQLEEARLSRKRPVMKAHKHISMGTGIISAGDSLYQRADAMTNDLVGEFTDPFSRDQTVLRGDQMYCFGNMVLCCLNLSYNNLEYPSLAVLYEVLVHQSWLGARATTGLLRVSIEGNKLPMGCEELFLVEDLLERAQLSKQKLVKRPVEKVKGRANKIG